MTVNRGEREGSRHGRAATRLACRKLGREVPTRPRGDAQRTAVRGGTGIVRIDKSGGVCGSVPRPLRAYGFEHSGRGPEVLWRSRAAEAPSGAVTRPGWTAARGRKPAQPRASPRLWAAGT